MKNYLQFFLDSLYRVSGDAAQMDEFLTRFYEIFFDQSPEIAEYFTGNDMSRQREMLAQSLHEMVEFSTTRVASERLRRVAMRHSELDRDVAPRHYDTWLDSLVSTVREFDPEFTSEVELSWRVVLAPGIAYMKYRYDRS